MGQPDLDQISLQIQPSCYSTSGTISLPQSTFLNLQVSEGNEGCSKDNFLVLMFYYKITRLNLGCVLQYTMKLFTSQDAMVMREREE